MRSLLERLNSRLVGVGRISSQRLRLRPVAIVSSAATRVRSSGGFWGADDTSTRPTGAAVPALRRHTPS